MSTKRKRPQRYRRDSWGIYERKDVICALPGTCCFPSCTCPAGEAWEAANRPPIPEKGKTVYRAPAGPHRRDTRVRKRPPGWSALSDWVLVITKRGRENWAEINCRQQAMETYCPRCLQPGKGKLTAVFPGYLFVRPGNALPSLRSTKGVLSIVMRGDHPDWVPKNVLKELRKMEDEEGIFVLPKQRPPELGEHVEIQIGAWKNHIAVYDGQSPEGRHRALLEFMGREIALEFKRVASLQVVKD